MILNQNIQDGYLLMFGIVVERYISDFLCLPNKIVDVFLTSPVKEFRL